MKFQIINDPLKFYESLITDVGKAKHSIQVELYKFNSDEVGAEIRDSLILAEKRGVKVKILIDYIGSSADREFFRPLRNVRIFRKIRLKRILDSHKRDHRKLIIIDGKVAYLGSANITKECIAWQELVLRFNSPALASELKKVFDHDWKIYNKIHFVRSKYTSTKAVDDIEILQDYPSIRYQTAKRTYVEMIKNAQKYIYIISPYFLPNMGIRNALKRAAKRKVDIKIITPKKTDVPLIDLFRGRYFNMLRIKGIQPFEYKKMIHSKLIITETELIFGSSNLDYRSFVFQYEINFRSSRKDLHFALKNYFERELRRSTPFDFDAYTRRGIIKKVLEVLIMRVRRYF